MKPKSANLTDLGATAFLTDFPQFKQVAPTLFENSTGQTLALRTETYAFLKNTRVKQDTSKRSDNLFIERYKNDTRSLRGPWKALAEQTTWYAHLFLSERTYFLFEPLSLVNWLETYSTEQRVLKGASQDLTYHSNIVLPIASLPTALYIRENKPIPQVVT